MSERLGGEAAPGRDGVAHLRALAATPRFAGSAEEAAARAYCARVLRDAGWDVSVTPFEYSALPGRYGTPIGGAIAMATVLATAALAALSRSPRLAAIVLAAGLLAVGLFARRMLGDGVLDLPWLRRGGENLVARRGPSAPRVWLVAHLDSKSQPVPSRTRVLGIALLALAIVLSVVAVGLTLATGSARTTLWTLGVALAVVGGGVVVASTVANASPGAVDNASGVAAVLAAAAELDPSASVGVLLPSAEELGLAGARAWVRAHTAERAFVLNCDGVDDQGALTLMYTRDLPTPIADAVRRAAGDARVRRMPPGLLLDSVAFADAGWSAATVSHGSLRTLARVHTPLDSLDRLDGRAIAPVARVLARAAEALAR
ncbi:MAG TPA: M28 family peptidase [Gemmatimonadaceae bacterium]|nr:M28 family peptidase [Gemmatimonadaceae bacterium]